MKKVTIGAGAAALVTATAGLVTAVHGSHSTTTAITRNDTKPVVINRPHASDGSPLPVTVIQPSSGPPIVIVGHGAPASCKVGILPDRTCSPGVADKKVTESNIVQTICHPGYTASVRNVPQSEKDDVLAEYGLSSPFKGEIDHVISLELGGSNDEKNLYPERGSVPNSKDRLENYLHRQVCSGAMSLADAQHAISTDWTKAYVSAFGSKPAH